MSFLGSLVGGAVSLIGGSISAGKQEKAAKSAQATYVKTTTEIADRQSAWDKELAQERYDTQTRGLDLTYEARKDALGIQGQSLSNYENFVRKSFGQEIDFTSDISRLEIENEIKSFNEASAREAERAVAGYTIRKDVIKNNLLSAKEAARLATQENKLRERAAIREAEREALSARGSTIVAAAEQGMGSTTSSRMLNEIEYLRGVNVADTEEAADIAFGRIQNDLQLQAKSARADLQLANLNLEMAFQGFEDDGARLRRQTALASKRAAAELSNLTTQRDYELESLSLEGQGLNLDFENLGKQYQLDQDILQQELDRANELADFVRDQTVLAAEGQADASVQIASAQASAQRTLGFANFASNAIGAAFKSYGRDQSYQTKKSYFQSRLF